LINYKLTRARAAVPALPISKGRAPAERCVRKQENGYFYISPEQVSAPAMGQINQQAPQPSGGALGIEIP